MHRHLRGVCASVAILGVTGAGPWGTLAGEPPKKPEETSSTSAAKAAAAGRVREITDVVLQHHIDPPARQQMVLSGVKALLGAAGQPVPPGLSRRVSGLTTPEQFAALIAELWPAKPAAWSSSRPLEKALVDGLLASVPGGAHLIPAKELKVQEQLQGNRYVGIHIQLGYDEKTKQAVIQELVPGGPADRAGGKKGDRIEQVDGVDTRGMKLAEVVDRLRGPVGTELTVKVRQPKDKEARVLKMTRETLFLPTVVGLRKQTSGDWDLKVGGPDGIAYVRIKDITASTPHELRKFAQQFDAEGFKALVLDLRDVSNAALHPTVLLADSLLERGTIGRVRMADRVATHEATPDALFRGKPIAVLVDRGTTCGAEWLAAALQDNHRATIVGTPTASLFPGPQRSRVTGRMTETGDVSSIVPLGDGAWSISLTTGRLERGDGRPIVDPRANWDVPNPSNRGGWEAFYREAKGGVKPDHLIGDVNPGPGGRTAPRNGGAFGSTDAGIDPLHDPALGKAVEVLRESLKKS